ncbi:MAG: ATP-binding protein [Ignavibacteriales bacterium]|nr:ATP-binding protein [Ignavibacteriales bacterium]
MKFIGFILLTAFWWMSVSAQLESIQFEHQTVEDGLSQNTVLSIFQDREGFLWFGTQDGLNRYDGFSFTIFKTHPADSTSISDNFVRRIYEDRSGSLWLGTLNGLNRYNRATQTFTRFLPNATKKYSLLSGDIMAIHQDREGYLWIGTKNGGLHKLDIQTNLITSFNMESFKSAEYSVMTIYEDDDEVLWMGTSKGLYSLNKERTSFTKQQILSEQPGDISAYSIIEEKTGRGRILWLGMTAGGLVKYFPSSGSSVRFSNQGESQNTLYGNRVWSMCKDKNGMLWLGTDQGLNIFDAKKEKFTFLGHTPDKPGALSAHQILSVFEDKSGVIWLGALNGGVNKYNRRSERFGHILRDPNNPKSLSHNAVWCFLEDDKKSILVGTEGGVSVFSPDGGFSTIYKHEEKNSRSLSFDVAVTMCQDRKGNIWVGTRGGGLNVFDEQSKSFRRIQEDKSRTNGLSSNQIIMSYEDKSGTMWFGADGGGLIKLLPYDGDIKNAELKFATYRNNPAEITSISNDVIGFIHEDKSGSFWIGTIGGGLNKMDRAKETFTRFEHNPVDSNSLSNNIVTSVFEDATGILWIGTGAGLNRFDATTQQFTHYTEADGLPNDFIYGILPDDDGNLWLSTNRGISRFIISNFNVQEERSLLRKRFRNFDIYDGLQGYEFNANAYYRSSSGELFFGGPNGFNKFYPNHIKDNQNIPSVVVTSFRRLDKLEEGWSPRTEATVELSHTDYFFSFEFVALDFTDPITNQFQYMMEGFDRFWIDAGTRRYVTYTNLDAGTYVFRVRGSNNDGVWNERGASVNVIIQPPFWRTWWFIVLVAGLLALIIYMMYRYRLGQIHQIEHLRVRLASDLHDELATNLSSIAMFGELLQKSESLDEQTKSNLHERIITLSRESVNSIREIIWTIDPKPDKLHTLLLKFRDLIQFTCHAKNIELVYEIPAKEEIATVFLSSEVRKEFWLMIKEAVNNTIKHASCSQITVQATHDAGLITIRINDNGAGFDPKQSFRGKGLANMLMRAKKLNGSFDIISEKGMGTTILITARV